MFTGLPFVGLATTEYVTLIENEISGFIHTDINYLIEKMHFLLHHKNLAAQMGTKGKKQCNEKIQHCPLCTGMETNF